ncbi:helix-turn-helix domain-containing protein [Streptomyces sp. NPDC057235]|uniref:helix-turn-helix domain-containing protein n=1 Tax=Streptomyces sp. NPDC057235 TaxID=3346058 RepID=UPI003643C74D
MDTQPEEHGEDFAQLLDRLKDTYGGLSDSEVARRLGLSNATVNLWVHRKRIPSAKNLEAIAAAFPAFTRDELFASTRRRVPGKLTPDREERIMQLIRGLTAEQQDFTEAQLRGLHDANKK